MAGPEGESTELNTSEEAGRSKKMVGCSDISPRAIYHLPFTIYRQNAASSRLSCHRRAEAGVGEDAGFQLEPGFAEVLHDQLASLDAGGGAFLARLCQLVQHIAIERP